MARPRVFSALTRAGLVSALRLCRNACTDAMREMPITGEAGMTYRGTEAFLKALDDYVGVLTGDRTTLHDKLHSWPK